MAKIFVSREIPNVGIDMLRAKGYEIDIYPKSTTPSERKLISYLKKKNYDVILSLLTDKIHKNIFDAAPSIKMVANYAVGYNNIDLDEAKKRGITVTNTQGTYSFCIAEHAVAMMLGLTTRMVEGDTYVRKGKYKGWCPMKFMGTDMKDKKVGLIGVGRIGSEVAKIVRGGFNASILYYDVNRNEEVENKYQAQRFENVEDLLKEADIISLHVPLLDSTHHLIDEKHLAMMKPSAFLINTSRGPVINEKALVTALQKGIIRGAGLDVFEYEPKLTRGLTKLPNVILTPHIASARQSARDEMSRLVAENIIDFIEGRTPKNKII